MNQKDSTPPSRRANGIPDEVPARKPQKPPKPEPSVANIDPDDPVDRASADSFPASDPPSFSVPRAMPGAAKPKPH